MIYHNTNTKGKLLKHKTTTGEMKIVMRQTVFNSTWKIDKKRDREISFNTIIF